MSPARVHALPAGFTPATSSAQPRSSAATTPEQRDHIEATADTSHGIAFSRATGLPVRMGKATAEIKGKFPECVKDEFVMLAHSLGLNESELLRVARCDNQSGVLGAHYRKDTGRFSSSVTAAGKAHLLGSFDTAEQAHDAYVTAKRRLHEGCTL